MPRLDRGPGGGLQKMAVWMVGDKIIPNNVREV